MEDPPGVLPDDEGSPEKTITSNAVAISASTKSNLTLKEKSEESEPFSSEQIEYEVSAVTAREHKSDLDGAQEKRILGHTVSEPALSNSSEARAGTIGREPFLESSQDAVSNCGGLVVAGQIEAFNNQSPIAGEPGNAGTLPTQAVRGTVARPQPPHPRQAPRPPAASVQALTFLFLLVAFDPLNFGSSRWWPRARTCAALHSGGR